MVDENFVSIFLTSSFLFTAEREIIRIIIVFQLKFLFLYIIYPQSFPFSSPRHVIVYIYFVHVKHIGEYQKGKKASHYRQTAYGVNQVTVSQH